MAKIENASFPSALYFMPDISGFTRFVEQTEIEHSLHIIQELFDLLIQENTLDFNLIEVEGDALFFYDQKPHSFPSVERQVNAMLKAFHTHIARYEHLRICNCGACMSAINLKIKFILHVGDLHFISVQGKKKPYGHDVNLIHRLLKNEVPLNQYLLLSEKALTAFDGISSESFEKITTLMDLGELTYYYKPLPTPPLETETKVLESNAFYENYQSPDLRVEKVIDAPQDILFEYVSDLQKRQLWDKVPRRLEFEAERVTRHGTEHNCIVGSRTLRFRTAKVDPQQGSGKIYTEQTEDIPFLKKYQYYVLIEPINQARSLVQVLIYYEADLLGKVAWNVFTEKRLKRNWKEKLEQLSLLFA